MSLISIDPGVRGGIAYYCQPHWEAYRMPDTVRGIAELIRSFGPVKVMIVERAQAMPKQGSVSMFNYGMHYGGFEAIAACLGISFVSVPSRTWKKVMGLTSDKTDSIKEAGRLFPEINLVPKGCQKPWDGLAEALLLGAYAIRTGLNR